jgi:hypothetical protein
VSQPGEARHDPLLSDGHGLLDVVRCAADFGDHLCLARNSTLEVVQRLLQRLTILGFSRMTLFLDKEFCGGDVLRHLQAHHQPAILACAIRGKTGGTRLVCWTPQLPHDLYPHRWHRRRGGVGSDLAARMGWSSWGLTLVLVNVWIALRWAFARQLGRGPRRVDPDRFRFHRFIHFLTRAIGHALGVIMSIPTHHLPQFVIY